MNVDVRGIVVHAGKVMGVRTASGDVIEAPVVVNAAGPWAAALAETAGVDRLMFQDGVGAGKLALDDLEPYYTALQRALHGVCQFQIVVETFTQVTGAPAFAARPAPLDRCVKPHLHQRIRQRPRIRVRRPVDQAHSRKRIHLLRAIRPRRS